VTIESRASWGARAPKGTPTRLASTHGVKAHYTGGRVDPDTLTDHKKCRAAIRGIQNGHMDGNGWQDIGYSMWVCSHTAGMGRGPKVLPAANGAGLNSGHYAILFLVGNAGVTKPTDNMKRHFHEARQYLRDKGGAGTEIKGHRDGYATDCPGGPIYAWVKAGAPKPGGSDPAPPKGSPGTKPASGQVIPLHTTLVQEGSDNAALVKDLQRALNAHGWDLKVDGDFGPATLHAVRVFQDHNNLAVDGDVGPLTWRKLAAK